ncbi:Crp/Fnr family transcriptional regulator [uncultured Polaribacter sp.]|jgi:CRP/FNR family transcriptional regulator|uniref:Crp/Fnr family transcriptional regulator n=1 Tax=uncultured Polaribacter sp. TaxID=174711 RepID=UPI00236E4B6D|nr:Crp/Fnr family transcriptional regulator [Polaribacter sp.]
MIQELKNNYGHLFEDALLNEINQVGTFKEVAAGFKMMEIGDYVKAMPLLVSGAIKILRQDTDGDELLLYFLEKGDTCALTLTCCVAQTKSKIRAIAETDSKLIMIPIQQMEEWSEKYKSWRHFVFESYNNRLNEMLETIDSIAFLKMDERLLKYLAEKVRISKNNTIHKTHQEIAYELHTSRVVISRLLKKLETLGKIELNRNAILIKDI